MDFVIGGRTETNSYAVSLELLTQERVVEIIDDAIAVYDQKLNTGYIYQGVASSIKHTGTTIEYDGSEYSTDNLPFERVQSYLAKWFAWHGYFSKSMIEI